MSNDNK